MRDRQVGTAARLGKAGGRPQELVTSSHARRIRAEDSLVDAAEVVRAARRHAGWSQRQLAGAIGAAVRSVAAWEAGRHQPSTAVLDRVLAATGLDLVLAPRLHADASAALVRHLRLSLTQRLRLALGESPALSCPARSPVWAELGAIARRGQVVVEPPLAPALWLPLGRVGHLRVSVFHAAAALALRGRVDVRLCEGDAPAAAIPFMMEIGEQLWVLPPGELALPSPQETQLRVAGQLLHAYAPLDDLSRRRPAHRDPDEPGEDWRMLRTKTVMHRPDMRDGRGWRLGAAASLAQRLNAG